MRELEAVLKEIAEKLPDFVAIAVVTSEGLTLAGFAAEKEADISIPAGMFAKAKEEVDKAFEITEWGQPLEYMFTSDKYIVLLTSLPDKHYLGIAVKASANLGMTRAVRNKYLDKVKEALSKL